MKTNYLLKPPPLGPNDLAWLVNACPNHDWVCHELKIDPRTLKRWLEGQHPPHSALLALFWASNYGECFLKATLHNLQWHVLPALGVKKPQ